MALMRGAIRETLVSFPWISDRQEEDPVPTNKQMGSNAHAPIEAPAWGVHKT